LSFRDASQFIFIKKCCEGTSNNKSPFSILQFQSIHSLCVAPKP
jgi:hypothetical protein